MAGSPSGGEYDRKEQWGGEFHAAGERATNGIPNESARIGWTREERERRGRGLIDDDTVVSRLRPNPWRGVRTWEIYRGRLRGPAGYLQISYIHARR